MRVEAYKGTQKLHVESVRPDGWPEDKL